MKHPPPYNESLVPLTADTDIEKRVSALVGRACVPQLWFLYLDDHDVQLPLLMPVANLPTRPHDAHTELVVGNIRDLMGEIGAACIVLVWERPASRRLSPDDLAWARSLARACDATGVRLRGVLLSHRSGVRWVAPDDYR